MKKYILLLALCAFCASLSGQRLIIRGDDMGSSHAANVATIESYKEGIMRSAEIMIVCNWVPEAVAMLKQNPGIDVGLHITFTSEWSNNKWRPLTDFSTARDEYGYFLPRTWASPKFPDTSLQERDINLQEAETELRAQIELALKLLPDITHCTGHMGAPRLSEQMLAMVNRVCGEYGVPFMDGVAAEKYKFENLKGVPWGLSPEKRRAAFIAALEGLEKGKTYMFLEHPAIDGEEMRAIHHIGYEGVAVDRQAVTDMFTDQQIMRLIEQKSIELVSYGDLIVEYNRKTPLL